MPKLRHSLKKKGILVPNEKKTILVPDEKKAILVPAEGDRRRFLTDFPAADSGRPAGRAGHSVSV